MKNVFIVLFFLLASDMAFSQTPISMGSGDNYYYQSKKYKAKELKEIIMKDEEAYSIYKFSHRKKKHSIINGFSALAICLASAVVISKGDNTGDSPSKETYLGAYGFMITAGLGVLAFGQNQSHRKKLKEAIDVYNGNKTIPKSGSLQIDFQFINSENGIGLGLRF